MDARGGVVVFLIYPYVCFFGQGLQHCSTVFQRHKHTSGVLGGLGCLGLAPRVPSSFMHSHAAEQNASPHQIFQCPRQDEG